MSQEAIDRMVTAITDAWRTGEGRDPQVRVRVLRALDAAREVLRAEVLLNDPSLFHGLQRLHDELQGIESTLAFEKFAVMGEVPVAPRSARQVKPSPYVPVIGAAGLIVALLAARAEVRAQAQEELRGEPCHAARILSMRRVPLPFDPMAVPSLQRGTYEPTPPEAVPCPTCGAAADERCRNPGAVAPRT